MAAQSPKAITRLLAEDLAVEASGDDNAGGGKGTGTPRASPAAGAGKLPPPPPMVTVSLSMKTVVSPRSHTHEVVALSALVHREVRLDGPSPEDGKHVSQMIPLFLGMFLRYSPFTC